MEYPDARTQKTEASGTVELSSEFSVLLMKVVVGGVREGTE